MEVVAQGGVSVLLSSHLIADLERVCDYLVILARSRVQLAGEVTDLLATLLVRSEQPVLDPSWNVKPVSLDDLVRPPLCHNGRQLRRPK